MLKNLKWYMSATGLSLCASTYAIDFLEMGVIGLYFLPKMPNNAQMILLIVPTLIGFFITWFFFRKLLKPLKIKEYKIFIFTLITYLIFIVVGSAVRGMVGLLLFHLQNLGVPFWIVILAIAVIVFVLINALLLTMMVLLNFPELSKRVVFKNMIYANILSLLASILCLSIFYKIYPQRMGFIDLITQPKREPDRVREMVKNMPYSHDLSESDFR